MELFFIFIFLKSPTGIDVRALERPYYSADECATMAAHVYRTIKPKYPKVAGALCYTIDEISEAEYLPMKRPL